MSEVVDQRAFRQLLKRNIILPLALGIISCAVFVTLIFYIMNLNGWVFHTNSILIKAGQIEKSFGNAVAGLRGYVLTDNPGFLESFELSLNTHNQKFDELLEAVKDNPEEIKRVLGIREQYENWFAFANNILQAQAKKDTKTAKALLIDVNGKKFADDFDSEMEEFRATAEMLRTNRVQSQQEFARIAMGIAIVLNVLFGVLIAIFGRRQLLALSSTYEETLQKQKDQNEILNIQNWMKTAQAELSEKMTGEIALDKLSSNILNYVSNFLNAKIGAMYVLGEHKLFNLKSTYAYSEPALTSFGLGQTLLGQAAVEGKITQTTDLPSEYFKVSSGLGDIPPKSILIVPVNNNKEVNAVMEFGFTEAIEDKKIEWLEIVLESIGLSIKTANYKEHLERLLEEVQNQAQELQSQQEELRVNNEELEEQTKLLRESQVRLESQHVELEQTNAQLEEQAQALENQAEMLQEKNRQLNLTQVDLQQKTEDLKSASQYKSEFLANMSHELRTPLNSSLILAKLLSDNKTKNLTDQQVEYATQILNSGNDLLTLINDILDLSKVEAGKLEVSPDNIDVSKFLAQLEKTFHHLSLEKNINFKVDLDKEVPKQIFTDSLRLEQILKNLLSNAFKFTMKGSVTLKVCKSKDFSTFVEFKVIDTGIGIESKQQDVIFEAFRQADGTTNRRFGGTGLGLSISKNLTHLLGGEIKVESVPGSGSTFSISIPENYVVANKNRATTNLLSENYSATKASKELKAKVEADRAKTRKEVFMPDDRDNLTSETPVVLIVEDDPSFARVLYDMAKELKFNCVITDIATEGYELAVSVKPQAIILDIHLPDHSGLMTLDRLKRNISTHHIPVHVISGMDFVKDALEMGAIGYALKPTKEEELKNVFKKLQSKIAAGTQKVLIIEDDKVQREAIKHLIKTDSVEPVDVGTGEAALEILSKECFDCIIVDLNLPDMTGFELIEKIAKLQSCQSLPVIVYTGKDLSLEEEDKLRKYSKSIIVKGARSPERLLSEVTLFLHQVSSMLDPTKQKILEDLGNREKILDKKKVLVVDDDMRNVFALTAALESRGAKVAIAKNGKEALNKLDEQQVDIVLMDIMMPVMDGYKAMKEIRKQSKFDNLPIIALTAKAMKDDRELCLKAGASDYLTKPIDVEKLLSLVRVWITHKGNT